MASCSVSSDQQSGAPGAGRNLPIGVEIGWKLNREPREHVISTSGTPSPPPPPSVLILVVITSPIRDINVRVTLLDSGSLVVGLDGS